MLTDSYAQIVFGFLISALFLSICARLMPFVDYVRHPRSISAGFISFLTPGGPSHQDDDILANVIQLVVTAIAFQALLQEAGMEPNEFNDWLLIFLNVSISVTLVVQLGYIWRRAMQEASFFERSEEAPPEKKKTVVFTTSNRALA